MLTGSGAPSFKPGGSGLFGSDPPKPQSSRSIGLFGNLDITNTGGPKPSAFGSVDFATALKNDRSKSNVVKSHEYLGALSEFQVLPLYMSDYMSFEVSYGLPVPSKPLNLKHEIF